MAQEFAVFSIKRRQGQWQLKVGHYIGVILLPSGMTLEILPKLAAKTSSDQVAQQSYLSQNASHRPDIRQTRQWVQGMLSDLTNSSHAKNKLPNTKNLGQFSSQLATLSIDVLPLSDWLITQFCSGWLIIDQANTIRRRSIIKHRYKVDCSSKNNCATTACSRISLSVRAVY